MQTLRSLLRMIGQGIVVVVTLFVLRDLLLTGGCMALGLMLGAADVAQAGAAELASQQAKLVPLPPQVQRLTADDYAGWLHQPFAYPSDFNTKLGWLSQDPSGRYALTGVGLYDFATNLQTPLNCPRPSEPGIDTHRRWLDDQVFLWNVCVFQMPSLQPGAVERVWCGPGRASCSEGETLAALANILQRVDRVYREAEAGEYVFVQLSTTSTPPHAWAGYGTPSMWGEHLHQAGLEPKDFPLQDGRSIAFGSHRLSPDGVYDASIDDSGLTVTRTQDGALVAQTRSEDFHATFGITSQRMWVSGWTDDSRQVIFVVQTILQSRRSLAQVFALSIP